VVEPIVDRLQRHPELVNRVSGGTVAVPPSAAEGFSVSLTEGAGQWVVAFDGWHKHFTSDDEALCCFAFGLSDHCRLRAHFRGSLPYLWAVEERTKVGWRESTGHGRCTARTPSAESRAPSPALAAATPSPAAGAPAGRLSRAQAAWPLPARPPCVRSTFQDW
jgi:hypothetical protein